MKKIIKSVCFIISVAMLVGAFSGVGIFTLTPQISVVAEGSGYSEQVWNFEDGTIAPFSIESGGLSRPIGNRTTEINSPYASINKEGAYYFTSVETGTGTTFSDKQVATLVSPLFYIGETTITLKLAGGKDRNTYVALYTVDGAEIARISPNESRYVFKEYTIDLTGKVSIGQPVVLKIVDADESGWGFIAVDDIRFTGSVPSEDVVDINFDFESGALEPFYFVSGSLQDEGVIIGSRTTEINSPCDDIKKQGTYYFTTVETVLQQSNGLYFKDAMTATVRSRLFTIDVYNSPIVTFKIGGGSDSNKLYVALCKSDGTVVAKATRSSNRYIFEDQSWDLTGLITPDDLLYLEIVDKSESGWGNIIFDDFKARGTLPINTSLESEQQVSAITGWSSTKFANLTASVQTLIDRFGSSYPKGEMFINKISQMAKKHDSFWKEGAQATDNHIRAFAGEMETLKKEIALANPYISGSQMMVVSREQYGRDHHNTHTMFPSYAGEHNDNSYSAGGAVRVVDFASAGKVTTLLSSATGVYRDTDISYDGNKFLVSYRKDITDSYHIYEYTLNESKTAVTNEKQLTSMYGADDMDPMYMPSGNIVFTSTREPKYVQCNRQISANIYRMESDGANIIQLTNNTLFDRVTDVLPDGRILYDRWEYNDRDFGSAQGLWTVLEDGTQQVTYYGNNSPTGGVIDGKVIPGTNKVAAIFTSTHDQPWGAFTVIDRSQGVDGAKAVEFTYPASSKANIKESGQSKNIDAYNELEIKYEDPQPLDENFYLVSRQINAGVSKMGIYLIDNFGNETLLYEDENGNFGAYDAVLIQPRVKETVVSERRNYTDDSGKFVVQNVYEGTQMQGVETGSVKTLRVVEIVSKYTFTKNNQWQGEGQQNPGVNWHSFEVKRVLGEVPVYKDGSAYFEVPENTFVYFQLLDKDGKMIQSMRSGTSVQSGETVSCVGCHENRASSVPDYKTKTLDALSENFQIIDNPDYVEGSNLPKTVGVNVADIPQKRTLDFETGTDSLNDIEMSKTDSLPSMNYLTEVQPIFTNNCTSCHGYENPSGNLTLVPDKGIIFNASYVDLWRNRGTSSRFGNLIGSIGAGGTEFTKAKSWGSYSSPLVNKIFNDESHSKLLTNAEKRRIAEWVDLNATYYGDYASNYAEGAVGRSPLTQAELVQIPGLNWDLNWYNTTAMPIYFDNPEKSPLLKNLTGANYNKALQWIKTGKTRLVAEPDVDWDGLTTVPGDSSTPITPYAPGKQDAWRFKKVKMRAAIEKANREAIASGKKRYDSDNTKENGYLDWPEEAFPGYNE